MRAKQSRPVPNIPLRPLTLLMVWLLFPCMTSAGEGVVLLHGLCRTKASMAKLERALTAHGYTVENVDYDSRCHSIETLGEEVIGAALASERLRECTKIHFVTHSLGGMMVRSYFKRHDLARLGRVVMLAPPNQGSEVTDKIGGWLLYRKINGPAGSELGTDEASAPHQLGPINFDCGVIAGDWSNNWINSLMIPGPDDGKVSIERSRVQGMKAHKVVHTTHTFIMQNREVIESTVRFLRDGTFEDKVANPARD
jgi:triacylglycerol lipase